MVDDIDQGVDLFRVLRIVVTFYGPWERSSEDAEEDDRCSTRLTMLSKGKEGSGEQAGRRKRIEQSGEEGMVPELKRERE